MVLFKPGWRQQAGKLPGWLAGLAAPAWLHFPRAGHAPFPGQAPRPARENAAGQLASMAGRLAGLGRAWLAWLGLSSSLLRCAGLSSSLLRCAGCFLPFRLERDGPSRSKSSWEAGATKNG